MSKSFWVSLEHFGFHRRILEGFRWNRGFIELSVHYVSLGECYRSVITELRLEGSAHRWPRGNSCDPNQVLFQQSHRFFDCRSNLSQACIENFCLRPRIAFLKSTQLNAQQTVPSFGRIWNYPRKSRSTNVYSSSGWTQVTGQEVVQIFKKNRFQKQSG